MIRTNIHLAKEQLQRLKERSEKTGLSVAELIRRAIDISLDEPNSDKPKGRRKRRT